MSTREQQAAWKRWKRATDPEWAERSRQKSREAKRRRRGVCEACGGETRYNGVGINGPSRICAICKAKREHDERRWTQDTILRAFRRFADETGRTPRALDAQGMPESVMPRISGRRIRELEQVGELGLVLPHPQFVRREFGSWSAALIAAGMQPSRGGSPDHRKRTA